MLFREAKVNGYFENWVITGFTAVRAMCGCKGFFGGFGGFEGLEFAS
jgi:hypothetical protein